MPTLEIQTDVPIYDDSSALNLPMLVNSYGVTKQLFSDISGVSISRLSKSAPVSAKIRVQVSELVSIYMMLWKITEGDENKIKRWLQDPLDEYFGLSPVQFMKVEKENIPIVLKNLHEVRYGEAMGA